MYLFNIFAGRILITTKILKMKKLIKPIALLALFVTTLTVSAQTNAKFGYIDSQKLINMMPGKDTVDLQLRNYQKELENTIESMLTEYQNKIANYQANVESMSAIIKKTKEQEIQQLEQRIQDFQQNADADFQARQSELYNPLLEKAKKAIEDVAEENGYTYIFDSSIGFLLYYEKGDNVMSLVKKKLGLE